MHDYNTILGVIELRLSKVSYDSVQKRYRIGRSGIALIMNRYKDSGLPTAVGNTGKSVIHYYSLAKDTTTTVTG